MKGTSKDFYKITVIVTILLSCMSALLKCSSGCLQIGIRLFENYERKNKKKKGAVNEPGLSAEEQMKLDKDNLRKLAEVCVVISVYLGICSYAPYWLGQ